METPRCEFLLLIVTLSCLCQPSFTIDYGRDLRGRKTNKQPHIILIMADDLGWNDVSFHGSDQIPTPNLDALAYNGVILNNHYSQALCTPSRSALLTGRYPIHTGMQHRVILPSEPWGLPLKERLLSQDLKSLGYSTHMVGKWHLGFHRKEYTPTFRGFDSHFGFWSGYQDYYSHQAEGMTVVEYVFNKIFPSLKLQPYMGLDMRRGMNVDTASTGIYSTDLFADEAVNIIRAHGSGCRLNCDKPLFLYVALSAPHAANSVDPLQAPAEAIDKFHYIADESRRKYAAMVWKMDESVGKMVKALEGADMLEDSIIVFLSDNGAQTGGIHRNSGSNYPLKGEKISPWEGGVKTVAFVWSPRIKNPGRVSNQLMHISDWMPTLIAAAGGNVSQLRGENRPPLDGVDISAVIFDGLLTPTPPPYSTSRPPPHTYHARSELLVNIDDSTGYAAIRVGNYKLVQGTTLFGLQDHWVGDSGRNSKMIPLYNTSSVTQSIAGRASQRRARKTLTEEEILGIRSSATIDCQRLWPPKDMKKFPNKFPPCLPFLRPCLFDVVHDPCEKRNLCALLPDVVKSLKRKLAELRSTAVPQNNKESDPMADPKHWGGVWTNWDDYARPTKAQSFVTRLG